ncbi:unnamed protein product [Orchesella dallaii]|uniref:Uncharacterized protein n=1 Tax=Orchesella dallaii TaxID=48710 RepID=A0ABP1RCI6_9HEXA
MNFANLVLGRIHDKSAYEHIKMAKDLKSMRKEKKRLSWHMYIGILLLVTNPGVHTLITSGSPCAPHFISSCFFECRAVEENVAPLSDKVPFLVFEFYSISLFLFMGWFNWSCIILGLAIVASELRAMRKNDKLFLNGKSAMLNFRELHIIVITLNASFRPFLMCFSTILYSLVAQLIFGSIRLLPVHPRSNLMFPLCALRCGFEATTPLAMAGDVSKESQKVLEIWRVKADSVIKKSFGKGRKPLVMIQRSCRRILCSAGSLYTFEHSVVLCSFNNCIQLCLNLLVTFGKNVK